MNQIEVSNMVYIRRGTKPQPSPEISKAENNWIEDIISGYSGRSVEVPKEFILYVAREAQKWVKQ